MKFQWKIAFDNEKNEYYTALCANILSVGYGIILGWTSPYLPLLQSDKTPLGPERGKLTNSEVTWLSSVLFFGNVLGTILYGLLIDRFGRKITIYAISIPMILGALFMILSTNIYLMYLGRGLNGMVGGGIYLVIPIYISEISNKNNRGKLGSLIQICVNLGLVIAFILGAILDYHLFLYLTLIPPVLFIIGFYHIPDTPAYLMSKHKIENAEKSLRFFRNKPKETNKIDSNDFKTEWEDLEMIIKDKNSDEIRLTKEDFINKPTLLAILISITIVALTQLGGSFYIFNYSSMIFMEAGTEFLSPNQSSIVLAVILFLSSYISTFFIDRSGRKTLLICSSFFTGVCLTSMGIYLYMKSQGFDLKSYSWISILSLSGAIFNSAWGILTLPYVIVTEILPVKTKGTVKMIIRVILNILGFILIKYHYDMIDLFGLHGCMWLFAGFCFYQTIFVSIFLQETKGRTIEDNIRNLKNFKIC